jgi:hypothetical protein
LHFFLDGYVQFPGPFAVLFAGKCNEAFRVLLWDLQSAGVNLKRFGEREELILKDLGGAIDFQTSIHSKGYVVRLIGFSHGPSPTGWWLWFSEPSDEFAGDFRDMIERRMEMPGGWSDNVPLFL